MSATLWLLVHGCDTGSGGAVELSWKLRPASGPVMDKFVDCQADSEAAGWGPVAQIRLHWTVGGVADSHAWSCTDNHGATGFELPEGVAQLSIAPECVGAAQAAPGTYIAPAIVQRDVIRGETVSLGAVELVVVVSNCDLQPCICATPR